MGRGQLLNVFKEKYVPKLEFPEGWGWRVQTKKVSVGVGGGMELHITNALLF